MYFYLFHLGNNDKLAVYEVIQVLKSYNINFNVKFYNSKILFIDSFTELDLDLLQKRLGSVIKISQLIHKLTVDKLNDLDKFIIDFISENATDKVYFSVNIYGLKKYKKNINKQFFYIKKLLKNTQLFKKIRFVVSQNFKNLSSVIIKKNKLLEKNGFDFNIIKFENSNEVYISLTKTVQDFEFFSKLDYDRPAVDSVSGMLPPKLALTLLNLAIKNFYNVEDYKILDPFCGSGTVVQMAFYLGFTQLFASDISIKAINDTRRNLANFSQKYSKSNIKVDLKNVDVKKISKIYPQNYFDLIVTETYLGPALKKHESQFYLENLKNELMGLYHSALNNIYKVLKNNSYAVVVLPIFKLNNVGKFASLLYMDLEKLLLDNFGSTYVDSDYIDLFTSRGTLIYKRDKQRVWREIVILKK